MSRPVRARGLKQFSQHSVSEVLQVAPRAGAWIETGNIASGKISMYVAPRAGAWIETCLTVASIYAAWRRAPCGRVD